jgi:hypothetical protein
MRHVQRLGDAPYYIVRRLPARNIRPELHIADHTVSDWTMFRREAMMDYVALLSEKLGGSGTIVDIYESCFGRRKYNRGRLRNTTWVFGGVERQSGKTFLVPVPDRSADNLTNIIHTWIEPGTTIISDCWAGYVRLSGEGYKHHTVNHTVGFVDPHTGAHTNTIGGTSKHVKVFFSAYNRKTNDIYSLSKYMLAYLCAARHIHPFIMFLDVITNVDWSLQPARASPASPTAL